MNCYLMLVYVLILSDTGQGLIATVITTSRLPDYHLDWYSLMEFGYRDHERYRYRIQTLSRYKFRSILYMYALRFLQQAS